MMNRILACLPRKDLRMLRAHLRPVELPLRMQLERAHRPIQHLYFPESGFASVVANGSGERSIEVGMIGREGVTGLALVLGAGRWPQETYMQLAGHGHRISAADIRRVMEESAAVRRCMLFYVYVFAIPASQTCLSNGRSTLEERLSRWLLMAHDRVDSDEMNLTHEFLAYMLGVRRPGVSMALGLLETRGLILRRRGAIILLDRKGLEEHSNGSYGVPEAEFERLFG